MQEIDLDFSQALRLDSMLKIIGVAQTGGMAKLLIQSGEVQVNGEVERRRGRKLQPGDVVDVAGAGTYRVVAQTRDS